MPLQECQRVTVRLGDDTITNLSVQRSAAGIDPSRVSASPSRRPCNTSSRKPAKSSLASRVENTSATASSQQSPGDEGEHVSRSPIDPLRIVDDAQNWFLLGRLAKQGEHRSATRKGTGAFPAARPKAVQRASRCGSGNAGSRSNIGARELVNRGKREFQLRLDTDYPGHPKLGRRLNHVFEECGLAHAWLSPHNQGCTMAALDRSHQAIQQIALPGPAASFLAPPW